MAEKQKKFLLFKTRKSFLVFLIGILFPLAVIAAVTLQAPSSARVSDTFKLRAVNPASGKKNTPHRGTDYAVPCYTKMSPPNGGTFSCDGIHSGYGGVASVSHECGVQETFNHLFACGGGQITTGGGTGNKAQDGNSTGCHLHYEVRINGTAVDPQEAYGKDLCDPNVQKQLIDDAQKKLNGLAGGGAVSSTGNTSNGGTAGGGGTGSGSNGGTGSSFEYVPTGGADPVTGVVNTGQGYYEVTDEDGRTHVEVDLGNGDEDIPALPPGDNPDVTPTTDNTDNDVTGCATDTWKAMVNQSVLQTRREMVANELYVTKPDSVMAYSCLAEHIKVVGEKAGPIFSETKRWVNKQVDIIYGTVTVNKELGEYSLDGAIVNTALEPYEGYMHAFFNHDFLGGLYGGSSTSVEDGDDEGSDQSYTPCGAMAQIWKMAKCADVDSNTKYYKFEDLISTDPRKFPKGYECNNTGITQDQIDLAHGKSVKYDKMESYKEYLFPGENKCADPIKTGVTVRRMVVGQGQEADCAGPGGACANNADDTGERVAKEKTYPDALCITPGCTYQSDGDGGGSCVQK